jgi:hypothetical protein
MCIELRHRCVTDATPIARRRRAGGLPIIEAQHPTSQGGTADATEPGLDRTTLIHAACGVGGKTAVPRDVASVAPLCRGVFCQHPRCINNSIFNSIFSALRCACFQARLRTFVAAEPGCLLIVEVHAVSRTREKTGAPREAASIVRSTILQA